MENVKKREGRVYESDEYPLDLYSPVEGKIEIKLS